MTILYAWICIFSPFLGAALTPLLALIHPKLRDLGAVFFSLLAALSALSLLPTLFHPADLPVEHAVSWLTDPINISFGILIDPLSIILANVVAVISFFIMVYCIGYMKGDDAVSRFWMWMNSFIGSMLLLVLANNLLFIFIGWKLVGVCSYGLIGFYYKDEEKYLIGGPAPAKFVTPSQAGIKALVMTGIGDLLMLGGILIIFFYSGTLNLLELYRTSAEWFPQMSQSPGMVILVTILILAGPLGKSAQFPLHEWLPEAMAGPGPVSALIHAATMVKSGVYLIARFIPIFYYGYWVGGYQQASYFFLITAWIGAITAFLAATQGLVSKELKKVLAYSTVSQIGYMMLGLGVAGLSPMVLIGGYTAGIFHLVSHALFKACLFLCAGTIIHAAHSIYMQDMGAMRKYAPFTWFFMMIAALSLIGLPPFPGFWSKDAVLLTVVEINTSLFVLALVTVVITSFYTTRMLGLVFYGKESPNIKTRKIQNSHFGEGLKIMWIPCGILAVLIVVMGLLGLKAEHLIHHGFEVNLVERLGLPTNNTPAEGSGLTVPLLSVLCVLAGALPAYWIYIAGKASPDSILEKVGVLRFLYRLFWERWYIDSFYNKAFVGGISGIAGIVVKAEDLLNTVIHQKIPGLFTEHAYNVARLLKTETRELAFNITTILLFFMIFIGFLLLV